VRIVVCHNYYAQRGGEDCSFEQESASLEHHGHEVTRFTLHNRDVVSGSRLKTGLRAVWNRPAATRLAAILAEHQPDIVHFTNTFPQISASCYAAAHRSSAATVQAVRNFRWVCPGAQLARHGRSCERCLGSAIPWSGLRHGCYRGSRLATLAVTAATWAHRWAGAVRYADAFYAPSEFAREKLIAGGLPADRLHVKVNSCPNDGRIGTGDGGYALFVGRLSTEKGIDVLLRCWNASNGLPQLKIVGDGPCGDIVSAAARANNRIRWLGQLEQSAVLDLLAGARMLVFPVIGPETFGRSIVEAFSVGTPVIATSLGAPPEIIAHEQNGLLIDPNDAGQLARAVDSLNECDESRYRAYRLAARRAYVERYTESIGYRQLMSIYQSALEHKLRSAAGFPQVAGADE
jgi:glycosyltransferase involved in cell wall biosynthesis